jgi:hypothetical protein
MFYLEKNDRLPNYGEEFRGRGRNRGMFHGYVGEQLKREEERLTRQIQEEKLREVVSEESKK